MNRQSFQQRYATSLCLRATRPAAPLSQSVQRHRTGFSLIEVIMATAILMGSTVVLMRLAGMGHEQFTKAKLQGEAQSHCETVLNEIVLGKRPLREIQSQPFFPNSFESSSALDTSDLSDTTASETTVTPSELYESDALPDGQDATESEWQYVVRIRSVRSFPQLRSITVTVYHSPPTEESMNRVSSDSVIGTGSETSRPGRIQSTLTRWVRSPQPASSQRQGDPQNSETSAADGEAVREERL